MRAKRQWHFDLDARWETLSVGPEKAWPWQMCLAIGRGTQRFLTVRDA